MRSDRELLELAAKAVGYREFQYCETSGGQQAIYVHDGDIGFWMPLTDDGDALRLAVKLRIVVEYRSGPYAFGRTIYAHKKVLGGADIAILQEYAVDPGPVQQLNDYLKTLGTDANAATRRAIVRVAAEIGAHPTQHTDGGAVYE